MAPQTVLGERIDGVLVIGGPDFIAATRKALALVARSRLNRQVVSSLPRIEEAPCSGMDVYALHPTYHVGDLTWRGETLWYASTIVHDSRHAELYAEARRATGGLEPPPSDWEGVEGEKKALGAQLAFMRELKAPRKTLEYLAGLAADPRYQDIGQPAATAPYDPLARRESGFACGGRYW
ncbi:MAG: hypothetical protein KGL53_04295 [Elusimicrobia bacterium]|nr:hypothetical protein [Elusimicrobiota bacterium]